MEIGEPPPDPFAGMNPQERKRAQESAILEMAYDLSGFVRIEPGERPDFALARANNETPFGVEITQLFPNESHARLNLVHGYHHRLWSGGTHLHKSDVKALQSMTVDIRDKYGNVKQTGVPVILTETPGLDAFRAKLCDAISEKTAKGYSVEKLTHLNLIILDWFNLPFDPTGFLTDRFFDDEVRASLRDSPFREVFLLIASTIEAEESGTDEAGHPYHVIQLQQLLAMERVYVTGHVIDEEHRGRMSDVTHLNELVIDHVSRVQGYGKPVEREGRLMLRYGCSTLEIGDQGMQVLDHQDFPVDDFPAAETTDRMEPDVEERVTERANANVLESGYAHRANRPSTWLVD